MLLPGFLIAHTTDHSGDLQGGFSADDEHLLHMMQLIGQTFKAWMLKVSTKAGKFFETNGKDTVTWVMPLQALTFIDSHRES